MTAQINDLCVFRGKTFQLAGISEGELFDPESLDMSPVGVCTACWRGYQLTYGVVNESLVVADLYVNLYADSGEKYVDLRGPQLNGKSPTRPQDEDSWFNNHYNTVNLELDYSGGILLASGFIDRYYVHMGYHPAWKYKTVHELIFENGRLVKHQDLTEAVAEIRKRVDDDESESSDMPGRKEIKEFVARSFDRSYHR